MKRIGVLTSGGDCSGMNAAVRAVVRAGLASGCEVVGIRRGYSGLLKKLSLPLDPRSVSNVLQRGGTFLHSARCEQMRTPEGLAVAVNNASEMGLDGLVVIGGDGSLTGALEIQRRGVPVVGIPASIDNDLPCTDLSLGVSTALAYIIHAVDAIKDTASSHARAFVIETMGRRCGYLALVAGIACGAEHVLVPEAPFDLDAICRDLKRRFEQGRDNAIILVAEGAGSAAGVAEEIRDRIGFETRTSVLGHAQRGGSPTSADRLLAARFGVAAVEALMEGYHRHMVGNRGQQIHLTDLEEVLATGQKPLDARLLHLAEMLGL